MFFDIIHRLTYRSVELGSVRTLRVYLRGRRMKGTCECDTVKMYRSTDNVCY